MPGRARLCSDASVPDDAVADYSLPRILIHLHIQKTAGTSLNSLVKHNFCKSRIFEWSSRADKSGGLDLGTFDAVNQKLQEFGTNRLRYISGHLPLGIHERLPADAKYFTLVRDPVERVISLFYWRQQSPRSNGTSAPFHINGKPLSLEEYVESSDVRLDNFQVRVLSGAPELNPAAAGPGELIFTSPVKRAHLEQAKDNIAKHFITAASVAHITECALILRALYGWPIRRLYNEKKNKNQHRPATADISFRVKTLIAQANAYDIELCEWIDKRFAEQRKMFEPRLSRDLRSYNRTNDRLNFVGKIIPTGAKRILAERILWR
jgi:hypothetical protein